MNPRKIVSTDRHHPGIEVAPLPDFEAVTVSDKPGQDDVLTWYLYKRFLIVVKDPDLMGRILLHSQHRPLLWARVPSFLIFNQGDLVRDGAPVWEVPVSSVAGYQTLRISETLHALFDTFPSPSCDVDEKARAHGHSAHTIRLTGGTIGILQMTAGHGHYAALLDRTRLARRQVACYGHIGGGIEVPYLATSLFPGNESVLQFDNIAHPDRMTLRADRDVIEPFLDRHRTNTGGLRTLLDAAARHQLGVEVVEELVYEKPTAVYRPHEPGEIDAAYETFVGGGLVSADTFDDIHAQFLRGEIH